MALPSSIKDYTLHQPRPLPVFLLLDASGSMAEHGKMAALNGAVADMLTALAKEEQHRAAISVGILAFGATVRTHMAFTTAQQALTAWKPLVAAGVTPMGEVFRLCQSFLENKDLVPSRSYRPTLVLISDGAPTDASGRPTDNWEKPLQDLLESPRGGKAMRLAMAIGADADAGMLGRFVANSELPVFQADGAREIAKFFRWVTMSVVARTRSTTPDKVVPVLIDDDDDIRY